ncbi:hypothetical protein B0H13DRAFT_2339815 [Mycena leptocephala]|nr:hypothetical protein B0H13DRAFT_2339815 [Mycena leptocephala]
MTQLDHDETSSLPVYDIDELDQDGAPIPAVYDIEEILAALTLEEGIERMFSSFPHVSTVKPAPPASSRPRNTADSSSSLLRASRYSRLTDGPAIQLTRPQRHLCHCVQFQLPAGISANWPVASVGPRLRMRPRALPIRMYACSVNPRPARRPNAIMPHTWSFEVVPLECFFPEVEAATSGFRFALQQGYSAIDDAHLVFEHAQRRGWTSDNSAWSSTPMSASDAPVPLAHEHPIAPLSAQGGPLSFRSPNDPWYVVYQGVNPGVFATSVECALNVLGISCSAHESVDSYAEAWQKFRRATSEGEVHFVPFPASPPPGGPPDDGPRNRDERNRQTRERMARLRAQDAMVAPDVLAARLAARREAACKYREKNRRKIALKARETRARAAQERARNRDQTDRAGR